MKSRALDFEIMTGRIIIDLGKCIGCKTKACVEACAAKIFKTEGQEVTLNMTREAIKKGGCTETIACELECQLRGNGALKIVFPMPELDQYIEEMKKKGTRVVYEY